MRQRYNLIFIKNDNKRVQIWTPFVVIFYQKINYLCIFNFIIILNKNYMKNLGLKLLQLRNKNRFSQVEVADKLDICRNTYCKWEAGKSNPSATHLQQIADFYKISVLELFLDSKNANSKTVEIPTELFAQVLQNQTDIRETYDTQFKNLFEKIDKNTENQINMKETYDTQIENLLKKIDKSQDNQDNIKKTFKELFSQVLQNQADMKETYDTQIKNLFKGIDDITAIK